MKPRARAWQETVAETARIFYRGDPLEIPLSVEMEFYVRRDRADLDNLCKAVLDGMQGIIFENDRQVKQLVLTKMISKIPCVIVKIKEANYVRRSNPDRATRPIVGNTR
jgi:Holliday junction resolvase RusA-like endonuclease